MRSPQDEADDVGLDLKQAAPSQIGRASRSAVTPACSSPSADSPQETDEPPESAAGSSSEILGDDSDEWDYDPFIDPDADPEPDDEPVDLPPSIQPRHHVAPAIPPPETISLGQRLTRFLLVLAVVILVPALLRTFVFQIYEIPSGSMERTLSDGDKVAVTMFDSYDIDRGDVVVFSDPDGWLHVQEPTGLRGALQKVLVSVHLLPEHPGHHLVKRVIGVGGDHVVSDGKGSLTVNGVAVKEPYVKDGQSPSLTSFDVTVPQGYVWVMGDNRSNSADSRYHRDDAHGGFVPLTNVVGVAKVVFQWTNLSRWGSLGGGEQAFSQVPDHDAPVPSPAPASSEPTTSRPTGPTQRGSDPDDPEDPDNPENPDNPDNSDDPDNKGNTSLDGPQTETGEATNGSERPAPGRIGPSPGTDGQDTESGTSGSSGTSGHGRSGAGAMGAAVPGSSDRTGGSGTDTGTDSRTTR